MHESEAQTLRDMKSRDSANLGLDFKRGHERGKKELTREGITKWPSSLLLNRFFVTFCAAFKEK